MRTFLGRRDQVMKKIIALGMVLSLLSVQLCAMPDREEVTYDGIVYVQEDEGVAITGYRGSSRDVITIPESIKGTLVTRVADEAFRGLHHPTGIILPDTVTEIGDRAFMNMNAFEMVLGEGIVSIGEEAFRMNWFEEVTLPRSVVELGKGTFYDSYLLETVVIPPEVTLIQKDTFKKCPALTKVIVTNPVCVIEEGAFDVLETPTALTLYGASESAVAAYAVATGHTFKPYLPIFLNGVEIMPERAVAELKDDKLFVPLRFVVEALKHTVQYEVTQGNILIDGGAFSHVIGTDYVTSIGGNKGAALESVSYSIEGVTMVSTDLIEQVLGCEIVWERNAGKIMITAE